MKTTAIIAEFNPLHNGHVYLMDRLRSQTRPDYIVIILSGDYTQRGEAAITDSYSRARMALINGADLVLELPLYYSLGSAEYFARGAVATLHRLGVIDTLGFGAETPDTRLLYDIASALSAESPGYRSSLKKGLQSGMNFASAREQALRETGVIGNDASVISGSNNILAIEYLRALSFFHSDIVPFAVTRSGSPHLDDSLPSDGSNASGAAIRKSLLKSIPYMHDPDPEISGETCHTYMHAGSSGIHGIRDTVPPEVYEMLSGCDHLTSDDDLSDLMYYRLVGLTSECGSEALTRYADVSHDVACRIAALLPAYRGFTDFAAALRTKNYSLTRIRRALLHILLGITADRLREYREDNYTCYARILGFKADAAPLLRSIRGKAAIPVFGTIREADAVSTGMNDLERRLFHETLDASRIYSMISHGLPDKSISQTPVIIR